jgi:hypothetical protein
MVNQAATGSPEMMSVKGAFATGTDSRHQPEQRRTEVSGRI